MQPLRHRRELVVNDVDERAVVPGVRIGGLHLGMRYQDVRKLLGDGDVVVRQRLVFARYLDLGVELVLTTPLARTLTPNARVVSVSVSGGGPWTGTPTLGEAREHIELALGASTTVGTRALYRAGVSVEYDEQGRALAFAVFAPLPDDLWPPPMLRSVGREETSSW